MSTEIDRLRRAVLAPPPPTTLSRICPSPARIWDAVRGELPAGDRRQILDHVAACAGCAEDWRIAAGMSREQEREGWEDDTLPGADSYAVVIRGPWTRHPRLANAAAALVVTLVGLGALLLPGGEVPTLPGSARAPAPVTSGYSPASKLTAGERLPRDGFLLRWTPGPEGTRYYLWVWKATSSDALLVQEEGLERPHHRVPPQTLRELEPGARLLWRVDAALPGGEQRLSQIFVVELQ